MEGIRIERRALQQLVAQALGQNVNQSRLTTGQMRVAGLERDFAALPVDPDDISSIQNESGAFLFIPGISDPGGDDLL